MPNTSSYWLDVALPEAPPLNEDLTVDVVVVGGGLTGITTAYLLHNEGVRVALLERGRFAGADTGYTTAHLTYVTDSRLQQLVKHFGKAAAQQCWRAGAAAIDQIEEIIGHSRIDCEFRRVPGYLCTPLQPQSEDDRHKELEALHKDLELARELGFEASLTNQSAFGHTPALCFTNQAKFHPRKYLRSMLRTMAAANVPMFERTKFEEVQKSPLKVTANGRRIQCDFVVMATHNPPMGLQSALQATAFQTKLSLYTSYVLGARLPLNSVPEALFWDTSDPYNYLRVDTHADHQYVIFGGEDVKTGQEDKVAVAFDNLRQRLLTLLPQAEVTHRWLGQVIETDDGLPLIGENAPREFIGTGFFGNGFTFGTLSAMMARDRFLGRSNEWSDLFRVDRKPFHGGTWRYVSENLDFPIHFVKDRLQAKPHSLDDIAPGEGKVIAYQGNNVAAYRSETGELTLCSAVCTHMKCLVRWNDVAGTWDCPCHGSRFNADGTVHSGPAEQPLPRIELPDVKQSVSSSSRTTADRTH